MASITNGISAAAENNMELFNYIGAHFLTFLGYAGYVVAGIFVVIGMFNKQANTQRDKNDKLTSELIDKFEKKADIYEEELELVRQQMKDHAAERDEQIANLQGDIKGLTAKNEMLENLFKGRDPAMQSIFHEAPVIFAIARENNALSRANGEAITKLTTVITDLVEKLSTKL